MRIRQVLGSVRLKAALSLGMVLGLGSVGTLAAWSTTASTTSGTFVSGTVDIKFDDGTTNGNQGLAGSPYIVALPTGTLLPGQSKAAAVKVKNGGTLGFTYTGVLSVATPGLSLTSVVTAGAPTVNASSNTCSGTGGVLNSARTVVAGAVDTICVQITLPTASLSTDQGVSGSVNLVLTATAVNG
ncbi:MULTISPECIES: SipW-dependent-type signal peptide-containing protein [Nocardiaceae]|uniref:Ribosomally synthesized peptide with SipW-like signal peptide n=1 Tax=Rhodococcoides corynebacterioides TaxID=53972 RepID=A0ABS2KVI5_9NOCA|nr:MULTISPECIES: SipW-dependent-type signal peptide-containing protein [Rhodococcus]MBM7415958.1 putative ribosomally synthesized peptide with SipW-like signal peptide [Rhodococcus corynebacterioides]MBP1114211.1 putative ribosomally synthesized peptide with SipW-like signal peptide [Rhodococcus sp. PvP016]